MTCEGRSTAGYLYHEYAEISASPLCEDRRKKTTNDMTEIQRSWSRGIANKINKGQLLRERKHELRPVRWPASLGWLSCPTSKGRRAALSAESIDKLFVRPSCPSATSLNMGPLTFVSVALDERRCEPARSSSAQTTGSACHSACDSLLASRSLIRHCGFQ